MGVRLAIDVGRARVGVARSDPQGLLAVPVATLVRVSALDSIRGYIAEYEPLEIFVGLPLSLQGNVTASTDDAEAFAGEIAGLGSVAVRMLDEQLSTVSAHEALHASGRSGRSHRSVVDQVAAVILLQHALDIERSQGVPAGDVLDVRRGND